MEQDALSRIHLQTDSLTIPNLLISEHWGRECYCHRHESHVPLVLHRIVPISLGGSDVQANQIRVCLNAHGAIIRCLHQMVEQKSMVLDSPIRRTYGRKVLYLASLGFRGAAFKIPATYPLPPIPPHDFLYVAQP